VQSVNLHHVAACNIQHATSDIGHAASSNSAACRVVESIMRGLPDRSSAPFRSDDPEAPLYLRPSLLLRLRFFFRAFFLRACSKQSAHASALTEAIPIGQQPPGFVR
jgi:hypothetical protein